MTWSKTREGSLAREILTTHAKYMFSMHNYGPFEDSVRAAHMNGVDRQSMVLPYDTLKVKGYTMSSLAK